jgi:hypothetical protein
MLSYIFVFFMGLLGTLLLKFQVKLMPKRYFFYAHLIDGVEENISFVGAFVRTLMPFIIGAISGGLAIKFGISGAPQNLGMIAGFLSIFFIVWPDFLNPELISSTYRRKRSKLYMLYVILLLAFSLIGYIGGSTINVLYPNLPGMLGWLDFKSIFNNLIAAVIFAAVSAILIKLYANSFQEAAIKSDHIGTANRAAEGEKVSEDRSAPPS